MYISVKFSPADKKSYTYRFDGHADEVADIGYVETNDGVKSVIVCETDVPEPAFACKPISFMPPEGYAETQDEPAPIGHNTPPDPIDEIKAAYADTISEAENWLDGEPVETEAQMTAVDDLRKEMRAARLAAVNGQKSEAAPLHDAWKAALARWKPTIEDFQRIEKGLAAAVDGFKRALAAKKEAEKRAAFEEAERKRREAEEAAARANAADLEAQREAARLAEEAQAAKQAASEKAKDKVKGLRTVHRYEITDARALAKWIWENDFSAMDAFISEYARKHHRNGLPGVKTWEEKEAY